MQVERETHLTAADDFGNLDSAVMSGNLDGANATALRLNSIVRFFLSDQPNLPDATDDSLRRFGVIA